MSISEDCIDILSRVSQYTREELCKILSLALDIPELFTVTDKELLSKLRDYEGIQEYIETAEDEYTEDESSWD